MAAYRDRFPFVRFGEILDVGRVQMKDLPLIPINNNIHHFALYINNNIHHFAFTVLKHSKYNSEKLLKPPKLTLLSAQKLHSI